LWEMKMSDSPSAAIRRSVAKRNSASVSVRPLWVHRNQNAGITVQRLQDFDALLLPTDKSPTMASGSTASPNFCESARNLSRASVLSD
jgi:hypothetical protein